MSESDVSTRKKPGRRTETPAERVRRLEQDIKLAREAEKEHRRRVHADMATALVIEAKARPEFMAMLRDILPRRVSSKAALTEIMAVLAE